MTPATTTLRFGVISDGSRLRAWQRRCVQDLVDSGVAELAVVVVEDRRRAARGSGGRLVRSSAAERDVDAGDLYRSVPTVRVEDVDALRTYGLDFVLHFGQAPLSSELLSLPSHGVWSFQHGTGGTPVAFWELHAGDHVITASLTRLTGAPDGAIVLRQGVFAVRKTSYRRTADAVCFGGIAWPRQVCVDIRNGEAAARGHTSRAERSRDEGRPGLRSRAAVAAAQLWSRARQVSANVFAERVWNVGVVDAPIHAFLQPGFRPRIRFLPLPLDDQFFADPFGLVEGPTTTILCEAFDRRTWHGSIAAVRVDGAAAVAAPVVVLADEAHMSYPFLVQEDGHTYCVPERRGAREVALYLAREFPGKWVRVATLLEDVDAVDATVFRHQDRWWLAYTDSALGLSDNLCLAHAEALRGPWRPHPGNPVKRDVRSSRPAGTPFVHHGTLYRPAQDASRTYGGRVVINRVTTLSPTRFEEESVATVEPDPLGPFPNALHTLATAGPFTLVDGRRDTFAMPRIGAMVGTLRRSRERRRMRLGALAS